jgi:23S rRNA (guanosine2251-2'-O)-methyltransferase
VTESTGQILLEGAISILAALEADSRPIHALYARSGIDRGDRTIGRLLRLAKDAGIAIHTVESEALDSMVTGRSHGGLVAEVGERRLADMASLCTEAAPFVAMLDGVEDPFNYGQAIRSLYAAGADGLVVRPRSWASAAGVVARSSAGASERIAVAQAETAEAAADFFRARGLMVAVTDKDRAVDIYDADLTVPLFLVIGGERRGVTRSFADSADIRLKIPYGRSFPMSLGTTPAAAALAFEVLRQRRGKQKHEG